MITGFDAITMPLSDEELSLVPIIVNNFQKNYVGKQKTITGAEIVKRMKAKNFNMSEPRLRKIMNHIRQNGMAPILANTKGYWWSISELEIRDQIRSLDERCDAIKAASDGLQQYLKKNFNQQLKLVE